MRRRPNVFRHWCGLRLSRRNLPACLLSGFLLTLAGCDSYQHPSFAPRLHPALGSIREDGVGVVDLLYATDRGEKRNPHDGDHFDARRTRELKLGECKVSIPLRHTRGRWEQPGLVEPEDPQRQLVLLETTKPTPSADFLATLDRRLAQSPRREIFIFVHGYAVTFDEAATRFAQIAHDVEFDGVPILFSWPTQGSLFSYIIDGSNAEWSARYLSDFLAELIEHGSAEHIHLLAHSMGARVLTYAMRNLAADYPDLTHQEVFDQVILAAADIDAAIFERDFVRYYARLARRVTMYVSTADWALFGAQKLNGFARLGVDGLSGDPDLFRKFDVVDATSVDHGLVGHVYYGSSPDVLTDLERVLSGAPTEQRSLRRHFVYLLDPRLEPAASQPAK